MKKGERSVSPYDNVYDVLIEQYDFAVSEISQASEKNRMMTIIIALLSTLWPFIGEANWSWMKLKDSYINSGRIAHQT
jgi:hypothetical protein